MYPVQGRIYGFIKAPVTFFATITLYSEAVAELAVRIAAASRTAEAGVCGGDSN